MPRERKRRAPAAAAATPLPATSPPASRPSGGWRTPGALMVILAIAAFLRLFELTSIPPALASDEAHNGNDILEAQETGHYRIFYPQNGGREGLFINIQAVFVAAFGNKPWALRLPSALFGILGVWGVFFCGRALFGSPAIGLAASFFMATSFWHVNFSRIGLRAICGPAFLVWAVYLMIEGFSRAQKGRPYLVTMLIAGAVYGLGFHTYLAYRVTPLIAAVILLHYFARARAEGWLGAFWRGVGILCGTSAVVVAPLAAYFIGHREDMIHRSAEISIFSGDRPAGSYLMDNIWRMTRMIFTKGDFDWLHNIAFRPAIFLPVALLFALGLGLGIREFARRRGFAYAVSMMWLLAGMIPAVLSRENMPNSIRAILVIPSICMLAAAAAIYLYERFTPRVGTRAMQAAAAVLAVVLIGECYHSYFDVWGTSPQVTQNFNVAGYDIAQRILAAPPSSPQYVVTVLPGTIGMPPAAQTVMFLTRTYTERQRAGSNIHYVARERYDMPDGVDLCRAVAASIRDGDVHCLQLIHTAPPAF